VAKNAEHALALANDSDFGLSATVFTADEVLAQKMASRLECGGVFINGYSASDARVAFGGVKKSGFGRELSHFGLHEFCNACRPSGKTAFDGVGVSAGGTCLISAIFLSFTLRTLASNALIQKSNMNITQIFRRLIPRQFGLLTGIFCIIALFSVLQVASSLMLSASVSGAQHNEGRNQLALIQQAKVDEARVALLSASDLLNRAGVYFMQDAATGSDGSWRPLMEEAYRALAQSKSAWDAWRDMKPQPDPDLTESYQRFYSGIQEQADGLMQSGSIDAFFAVPVQAFQTDFNANYALSAERWATCGSWASAAVDSLERLQNLFCLFLSCWWLSPFWSGAVCPLGDYATATADRSYRYFSGG
jgi:hypothetical protein